MAENNNAKQEALSPFDLVNVKMGTDNSRRYSHGNILPLATYPRGLASFTIQTTSHEDSWFYNPRHKSFEGIRLTHQPSPWINDYGQLIVLPQTGSEIKTDADGRWSSYREEAFKPNFMKGYLNRYRVTYELAPGVHGAFMRFTFDKDAHEKRRILLLGLNGDTAFEQWGSGIRGYTTACNHGVDFPLTEYFYCTLDCKFTVVQLDNGAAIEFDADCVHFNMSTSFISYEQALLIYQREYANRTLEKAAHDCRLVWESYFNRIRVTAVGEKQKRRQSIFYTCLYRALIFPRRFHEISSQGKPIHLDLTDGSVKDGVQYADNGFWDTFRTVYPLLSIVAPEVYNEACEGYMNVYRDSGWLPRWLGPNEIACMPGTLIEAVFADAIVKDVVGEKLAGEMLDAMVKCAETDEPDPRFGRKAVSVYRAKGYLPYDVVHESVNETLDCCYGDYCISKAAEKLGRDTIAKAYGAYAKNYKNVFDAETGFMRAKDSRGNFRPEFDPFHWGLDYTEGSAWQSSFAVYHDMKGLNALYGGRLTAKIDELFRTPPKYTVKGYGFEIHEMSEMAMVDFGQCAISNQPSFHIPYIYAEMGDADKSFKEVENLVDNAFTIDEFPGDEDNGTTASWFIFSCLGLYPFCPGRGDYVVTQPLFDKVEITVKAGKTLTIRAGKKNFTHVEHSKLMNGGEI